MSDVLERILATRRGEVADGRAQMPLAELVARADVERLLGQDIRAFLVGEAFMRAADPGLALRRLFAPECS